jgi:hypothetical protein
LAALHRASPVPFRASYLTAGLHPPAASAQRCKEHLYALWDYWFSPFVHFNNAPRGAHKTPIPSISGKTLVIASTHGNQKTDAVVNGQPVVIGVNAYIARPTR